MARRQAVIWENQSSLTGLGALHKDIDLKEQLNVRFALKMMRKAHIHGSRSDRERVKLEKASKVDALLDSAARLKKKKKLLLKERKDMMSSKLKNRKTSTLKDLLSDDDDDEEEEDDDEDDQSTTDTEDELNMMMGYGKRQNNSALRPKSAPNVLVTPKKKEIYNLDDSDNSEEEAIREKEKQYELYKEAKPIQIKTIDHIINDAKTSFAITKDRLKLQNQSNKYGKLKPIYPELISEIKSEEQQRLNKLKLKKQKEEANNNLPFKLFLEDPEDQKRARNLTEVQIRLFLKNPKFRPKGISDKLITSLAKQLGMLDSEGHLIYDDERKNSTIRPNSASVLISTRKTRSTNNLGDDISGKSQNQPRKSTVLLSSHSRETTFLQENSSSASPSRRSSSSSFRRESNLRKSSSLSINFGHHRFSKLREINEDGSLVNDDDEFSQSVESSINSSNSKKRNQLQRAISFGSTTYFDKSRSNSIFGTSSFTNKSVLDDEKISKVLEKKEEIMNQKEELLRKKIQEKEENSQLKYQLYLQNERLKTWINMIKISVIIKKLSDPIINRRIDNEWKNQSTSSKRALFILQKWWRKSLVRLKIKKNPLLMVPLRRFLALYRIRLRLKKKRAAANLIHNFLRDSTGISETMLKVYAFRGTVVKLQKWIRSWIHTQIYRTRLLWMYFEKRSKEIQKNERITRFINEKKSMKKLKNNSHFSDKLGKIAHIKKNILTILDRYDEHKKHKLQLEALKNNETAESKKKDEKDLVSVSSGNSGSISSLNLLNNDDEELVLDLHEEEEDNEDEDMKSSIMTKPQEIYVRLSHPDVLNLVYISNVYKRLAIDTKPHKSMDQWFIKVKNSTFLWKIFEKLRKILSQQRKRHIDEFTKSYRYRRTCPVSTQEIQQLLKNPNDSALSQKIAESIGTVSIKPVRAFDIKYPKFLMLTQGAMEQIDNLLATDKSLKIS